jgi:glycine dehydrogenase subunit 1
MGPQGLCETAELCLHKANYAKAQLGSQPRFANAFDQPTFKDFVVRDNSGQVRELLEQATGAGFLAGIPLEKWYPDLSDCFLVAVTEKRTQAEIDALVGALSTASKPAVPRAHSRRAGANV